TLHPTPCTLHPAPCTLHPTPYTLHPAPHTLHPRALGSTGSSSTPRACGAWKSTTPSVWTARHYWTSLMSLRVAYRRVVGLIA
ncbi:hypothetical protein T484DRAFT_1648201, partial [Baffinella frigidus]